MPNCLVSACNNKTNKTTHAKGIKMHCFPANIKTIKLWLLQIGQNFGDIDAFAQKILDQKRNGAYRLCSEHFLPESYVDHYETKRLRTDALPSIFPNRKTAPAYAEICAPLNGAQSSPSANYTRFPSAFKVNALAAKPSLSTPYYVGEDGHPYPSNISMGQAICKCVHKKMVDASTLTDPAMFSKDESLPWQKINESGKVLKIKDDQHTDFFRKNFHDTSANADSYRIISDDPPQSQVRVSGIQETLEVSSYKAKTDNIPNISSNSVVTGPPFSMHYDIAIRDLVNERKFIVFESCLDVLLLKLPCRFDVDCTAHIVELEKHIKGSWLSVFGRCYKGHHFHLWDSQPVVGDIALGNLLSSAAVLFSGSGFYKVEEMSQLLGLQLISYDTYYKYQRMFLFPTIDKHWQYERKRLKEAMGCKKMCLSGDKQVSKYSTYTFADVETKRILDFQVVQQSKTTTSLAMEKLAFETCLNRLLEENFVVEAIATDQHPAIKEIMCEKYNPVVHKYDIWVCAQKVKRQLIAASKRRNCSHISKWIPAIIQHLEWSWRTSHGDAELLCEKWQSLLLHITNHNKRDASRVCHACCHKALNCFSRSLPWIKKWSLAFHALRGVIFSSKLAKDLACLSPFSNGREIKLYHRFLQKYRPSEVYFRMDAVDARTKLAALTYNENVHMGHTKPKVSSKVKESVCLQRHKVVYSGTNSPSELKSPPKLNSNAHLRKMMLDAIKLCSLNQIQNCNSRFTLLQGAK
ncbi:uncharacterized protein rpusd1.L isoform X1 [Xenopus laevis]|uniref:THAP-type domain-containing protein n=2 Tax=Xenopus laevis TaxID=8355 RepID=A0A974C157_XENLA|nr:uncharacterized protein rpusd1.L isoform X1 [Xenopus laevis]OCT64446.1 hypothetical protein XELAEV_18045543mg [Xenopus laevis]